MPRGVVIQKEKWSVHQGAYFGIVSSHLLKKHDLSASVFIFSLGCNIQKYYVSNQNKLWNMLQAAFDHEKSFYDTLHAWKAVFRWVFNVISIDLLTFFKHVQNQFWPVLKYAVVFESDTRFVLNIPIWHLLEDLHSDIVFSFFLYFFGGEMLGSAAWSVSLSFFQMPMFWQYCHIVYFHTLFF